jgi:hypothetical protein
MPWWVYFALALAALSLYPPLRRRWLGWLAAKIDVNLRWAGNAAQLASACIAAIGFAVVIFQINETHRKADRDSIRLELGDARRLYLTYSEATLRYPELTHPDYAALAGNRVEFLRYRNFVTHMIYAYDDVLDAVGKYETPPDVKAWNAAFRGDVLPHRRYLCQLGPEFYNQYRADMEKHIRKLIEPCSAVAPPIGEPRLDPAAIGPG